MRRGQKRMKLLKSTIGLKVLMAVTGVILIGFVVVHMLGNLTIFISADAFNSYGHMLNKNPALKIVEYYLLAMAITHIAVGFYLTWKDKKLFLFCNVLYFRSYEFKYRCCPNFGMVQLPYIVDVVQTCVLVT